MATAADAGPLKSPRALVGEQRVILPSVGWKRYEACVEAVGEGHLRLACDGKDVELMSPSQDHERFKVLIARLIETLTAELNIPCEGMGSTTWRKPLDEKGIDPDECYYLANAERTIGRKIDLSVDPPPDLAVEIEITRSVFDRMGIYAALGVLEIWRFDGARLAVGHLQPDGTYQTVTASPSLPFLPLEDVVRWLEKGMEMGQTPWIRQFRVWLREELAPRLG